MGPPQRDPLDVGLKRYAQKRGLPPWVEEYSSALALGGILLFVLLPLQLLGVFSKAPPPPSPTPAYLSVVYGPAKVWAEGSSTMLKAVEVKVSNRGPYPAQGVSVTVTVHNTQIDLKGPVRLEPDQIASYRGEGLSLNVNSKDVLVPHLTCGNCTEAPPSSAPPNSKP